MEQAMDLSETCKTLVKNFTFEALTANANANEHSRWTPDSSSLIYFTPNVVGVD